MVLPVQAPAGVFTGVFTTTVLVCPLARSPKLQLSTWLPLMLQDPAGVTLSTFQVNPPVVGRGSLSVTFFAAPGPLLDTTIVKVSCPPLLNVAPSGVLERLMLP